MTFHYLAVPFVTWFVVGVLKLLINSLKGKRLTFDLIGYGGMPSNHSAIVSSTSALIFFDKGFSDPLFGIAITFSFIVLLDAKNLRGHIGKQAQLINTLSFLHVNKNESVRERIGHSYLEILAGILLGVLIAFFVYKTSF
jgi:hypothetical protein